MLWAVCYHVFETEDAASIIMMMERYNDAVALQKSETQLYCDFDDGYSHFELLLHFRKEQSVLGKWRVG